MQGKRRSTSHYRRYELGVSTRQRFAKRLEFRGIPLLITACAMILSLSFLSSKITEESNITHHTKYPVVSARGKVGVAAPVGLPNTRTTTDPMAVLGTSTTTKAGPQGAIPPKPAWVNMPLFTDPGNEAAQYLAANPSVSGAKYISRMAQTPVAQWFGDWNSNVQSDVNGYVSAAAAKGSVPQVVLYNIPNRDCGGYSVGGANGVAGYVQWVKQVAAGIGSRTAVVILEPDSLGALDCLPAAGQQDRTQSLAQAVTALKIHTNTSVYIDAGTPVWQPADVMASRLKAANVAAADGFSLNISYFASTAANRTYGDKLSSLIGNKHYVIDVSRNGADHAVSGALCNPSWAAFGQSPTTNTGSNLNDALLWIKIPWESDGPCNGSPDPGVVYWNYALQLAQNAHW